jgi:hypothetical protein
MGCSCHEAKRFFAVPLKNVRKVGYEVDRPCLLYRMVRFSIASAAENFRSTCGPERGPPECSTQISPAAAPHVGQGTTDICSEVSSFFFISTECKNIGRETVQFCTLFVQPLYLQQDRFVSI